MASFTIATLAGSVLAELLLDGAAPDLVVSDLLERLPAQDIAGVPRLLLGPRELGWSERLADLALAPGAVLTLVISPDPEKAAADLMGAEGAPVRLTAARARRAMGAAAADQAAAALSAVLSDPDAEVADEALLALRAMGAAVEPASVRGIKHLERIAQLAQDLEDPREICLELEIGIVGLTNRLLALLQLCETSPGQAALRSQTLLRRLAPLDLEAARSQEPLLADPLEDSKPEVRLARVAVLGHQLLDPWAGEEDDSGAFSALCGVLVADACLDVRRRAAALAGRVLGDGLRHRALVGELDCARTALAAEVEALRGSAVPTDRCRMEAVEALLELLN